MGLKNVFLSARPIVLSLVKLAREQADVLAFADRNREIVELPEGLETGKRWLIARYRFTRT